MATLSARRVSASPASSRSARRSMFCAALALVALARILSAWALSDGGLLLGVGALALAAPLVGLALLEVGLPADVVDVERGPVGVEVEDPVDDVLEQADVVADHHQPALVAAQEVAQPDDRVGVEVVGRLVQQQRLRAAEQDPGQLDAPALAAREGAERLAEHAVGQARGSRRSTRPRPRRRTRPGP